MTAIVNPEPAVALQTTPEARPAGRFTPLKERLQGLFFRQDKQKVITTAEAGIKNGRDESRRALLLIRDFIQGVRIKENISSVVAMMDSKLRVYESSNDPKDKVLGLSLKKAIRQWQIAQLNSLVKQKQNAIDKGDLIPSQKAELESEMSDLQKQINGSKESESGEAKGGIVQEIKVLDETKAKIGTDIPDPFTELANLLEVPAEMMAENPLDTVVRVMQLRSKDVKDERQFADYLKKKGTPKDVIAAYQNALRVLKGEPTKAEKSKKIILVGSGLAALFSFILLWKGATGEKNQAYA
ncbi:hypothetical protein A2767_05570 [Candidatus Roizmanbacteria bacterium RIFCSPHIGHO2_01_FULL_35_10]|uniref:Uncharacterized protein n=1 Tax=Candidatus Roizmanbacteria bacterium RIFCSPLOWO2_01_FULL_35_13 TaxID=1802055 RepID=A0A1F7IBM9_9BACT|nr:MAG: hypothetical protein A2767_05570 [Candidatus Roizmanbacteria bacterium RIFCSPHIGHO2_01_FULL_35_10]OGK40761.1 MAG: hypothetical protein A3A74_04040 [Candidatus Roizmanbacteria bacterium RIFCSPLOWO2_01_FULL_35_13]